MFVGRQEQIDAQPVYDGDLSPSVGADRYFDFIVPIKTLLEH